MVGWRSLLPLRRIYCVGKNYAEHARETGSNPARNPPFSFAKPPVRRWSGPAEMAGLAPHLNVAQPILEAAAGGDWAGAFEQASRLLAPGMTCSFATPGPS